jgi:hypothetical protein
METEGLLPFSQKPVIFPYTEPDQSSPRLLFLFLEVPFHIIHPSSRGSSKLDVSSCFRTKTLAKVLSKLPIF